MASEEQAKAVGRRIVQARLENGGMLQKDLADILKLSTRSVQAYEKGEVVPWGLMGQLSEILGRPVSWLLHGIEDEPPQHEVVQLLKEIRALAKEILLRLPYQR